MWISKKLFQSMEESLEYYRKKEDIRLNVTPNELCEIIGRLGGDVSIINKIQRSGDYIQVEFIANGANWSYSFRTKFSEGSDLLKGDMPIDNRTY